jgi:molecular chaperone GrpE
MATKRNSDNEKDEAADQAEARDGAPAEDQGADGDVQAADADRAGPPPRSAQPWDELASQVEEAQARHLRLAADFENYKKRARQEQLETIQYAAATLAERLLPVLDDAQRALQHAPEGTDQGWLRGVRLTFQHLEEALASVGVEPIESVGRRFDPKLDEAIGSEESDQHPDDTVLAELRRGYRMHDRVLRPALVKVSRRPPQDVQDN